MGAFEEVSDVNISDAVAMVKKILLNSGGAIVNSSSVHKSHTLGHTERPRPPIVAAYSASKIALNSLTPPWVIQQERNGLRIRVVPILICPGYNATKFNGYSWTESPAECTVIVKEALAKEGGSGMFSARTVL
ncbi:hypothetical protein B0H15DRAFT_953875 [Mycena belliarum]|uniref:Uncharacterized protein n=1 Tax=Mycena belliarum TaxID=1033014 RepID=A0AAD6TZL8_9AGAR|nr:hypothetical protein B0H15DRAFT_953875 [Mycena belliae]